MSTLVDELDVARLQLSLMLIRLTRASENSHLLDELPEAARFLPSSEEPIRELPRRAL